MSLKYFVLVIAVILISGCVTGDDNVTTDEVTPEVTLKVTETVDEYTQEEDFMETFSISSEAFDEGGTIPVEYTCDGNDMSPPLVFSGIPDDVKSIAVIMDDPDAPGGIWVHWVIYNIPSDTRELAKGMPIAGTLPDGSRQGTSDFGKTGYGGPCPPSGTHRYYFKAYALDTVPDLQSGASKAQLENAMQGHVLARSELMGRYGR